MSTSSHTPDKRSPFGEAPCDIANDVPRKAYYPRSCMKSTLVALVALCSISTILGFHQVMNNVVAAIATPDNIVVPQPTYSHQNEEVDFRTKINRPFMRTTSHTIVDSFYDIERKYKPESDSCDAWGNSKFIRDLNQSITSLLQKESNSKLTSFKKDDVNIYFAENVSVVVNMSMPSAEQSAKPSLSLEVDGELENNKYNERMYSEKVGTVLQQMGNHVVERNELDECSEYIEYPVMLVDDNIDTWNWWFFLQGILHHYVTVAMVQPMIVGNYKEDGMRVLFTSNNDRASRSFLDAFEFLFSDDRARDSRQLWNVGGSTSSKDKRYCFRKLLWAPSTSSGSRLLVNRQHTHSKCSSSIIYSYAAYLKAAMHIPILPRQEQPRVVWVGRDTSKEANPTSWQAQRIVKNQDAVISYLKEECEKIGIEFIVADFYGDKKDTSWQEQALFISKANVMIGMHGAGLNMFHFMPFNSVIVEIHKGTSGQFNSRNFVSHVREGAYFSINASIQGGNLQVKPVWDKLQEAIAKWKNL